MEKVSLETIHQDLEFLKKEVVVLKEHIEDTTLSAEDIEALDEYNQEKLEGKLTPHTEIRNELGV